MSSVIEESHPLLDQSETEPESSADESPNQLDHLKAEQIYQVLDQSGLESIGFREFCAFIMIVSAFESRELL
jgi:hypothetical protein